MDYRTVNTLYNLFKFTADVKTMLNPKFWSRELCVFLGCAACSRPSAECDEVPLCSRRGVCGVSRNSEIVPFNWQGLMEAEHGRRRLTAWRICEFYYVNWDQLETRKGWINHSPTGCSPTVPCSRNVLYGLACFSNGADMKDSNVQLVLNEKFVRFVLLHVPKTHSLACMWPVTALVKISHSLP
jgi:hypothetical protein